MVAIENEKGNAVATPRNAATKRPPTKRARVSVSQISTGKKIADHPALIQSLLRLDPILQFLTKATGKPLVPLKMLQEAIPSDPSQYQQMLEDILEIADRGILQVHGDTTKIGMPGADINEINVGFPPPPSMEQAPEIQQLSKTVGTLHASTKTAAKRRLAALKRSLKQRPSPRALKCSAGSPKSPGEDHIILTAPDVQTPTKKLNAPAIEDGQDSEQDENYVVLEEEKDAIQALRALFKFKVVNKNKVEEGKFTKHSLDYVLPKQASYAGSNSARTSSYGRMSETILDKFPAALMDAFALERPGPSGTNTENHRKLYTHQVAAIESAMNDRHTLVCTGTGSGKSLCFLLPVLAAAMAEGGTSFLLFPTKALAQDQMSKLRNMLKSNPRLRNGVKPGIIDGDVSHADRSDVAKTCNIILTNPDTLHAAILPGWKGLYKELLGNIKYIVIDEAHMYDGVFGAHVAMVLSRMIRLCAVCTGNSDTPKAPTFLACSATMSNPEQHFRLICPVASTEPVTVLAPCDDGSPRASKHFFVWNPPIMDANGASTGRVTVPYSKKTNGIVVANPAAAPKAPPPAKFGDVDGIDLCSDGWADDDIAISSNSIGSVGSKPFRDGMQLYRRHSADETALLLARAVANNVRCIAFCKTRNLVEWVYERTMQALKSDAETVRLANKVESYRGGYTAETRRAIEQRLFTGELTGVVGTSALELGVDIGGIDLTLHCGYPTSFASLLQQAGRAGRGAANLHNPSLAIMVSFNSPAEQHLWRHPKNLLTRGLTLPISMPINVGLVRGHLLCAGSEYPLTGKFAVTRLFETRSGKDSIVVLNDFELFGSQEIFEGALAVLKSTGLMKEAIYQVASGEHCSMATFKTHPVSLNSLCRQSSYC
jgi:DEAD/DEAH box helicase domain-containing protein